MWQAMLFHYSCREHQRQTPLVVVHKGDEPLLVGFERLVAAGGRVQLAPNARDLGGYRYSPRNTPVALKHAETDAEFTVLCEPDMVFLQPIPFGELALGPRAVTFDRLTYLDPDREEYQPALDEICRQVGLEPHVLRECPTNGGVPHIVPTRIKAELGELWLRGLEQFVDYAKQRAADCHAEPDIHWVSGMWSTVLAIHQMQLEPIMTQFCISNEFGLRPLPPLGPTGPVIIHYCYGGEAFNKRDFVDFDGAMKRVWLVPPPDGTINGAIRGQLREAREFYAL